MRFRIEKRQSGYTLTLCPSSSKGEGKKIRRPNPERSEACLPAGRDLLRNGNVILSIAKNPLNSVRIAEEIPPPAEPGSE